MVYKWCVVAKCTSTSKKTPDKLFVPVPLHPERRKKWLLLARRNPDSYGPNSIVYMCEDHFNMEKDIDNHMKVKMGFAKKLLVVDGALPSKFDWHQDCKRRLSDASASSDTFLKRQKQQQYPVEECKQENIPHYTEMPEEIEDSIELRRKALKELEDYSIDNHVYRCQNYRIMQTAVENDLVDAEVLQRLLVVCVHDSTTVKYPTTVINLISVIVSKVKTGKYDPAPDLVPSAIAIMNMIKTIALLNKVESLMTLFYQTLLSYPEETFVTLAEQYEELMEIFNLYCHSLIPKPTRAQALNFLHNLLKILPPENRRVFVERGISVWFSKIIPIVMAHLSVIDDDSTMALEILELLTDDLIHFDYTDNPHWNNILECICNTKQYPAMLKNHLNDKFDGWYRLWIVFIRLLKHQVTVSLGSVGTPINSLLPVIETAFKMDVTSRCKAFECWNALIDNFCTETNESNVNKRIKLLIIPLKLNNAKAEETALAKFKCWWHLICKFQTKMDKFLDTVLVTFLHFCFGRHNMPDKSVPVPGQLSPNVRKHCHQAVVELVGHVNCNGCTELPKLNNKLINTKHLVDNWNHWIYSITSVIMKTTSGNGLTNQQLTCLWKSFLMTIGELPENNIRKDLFSEVLSIVEHLIKECKANSRFLEVAFNALILSLFDEDPRIKELFKSDTDKKDPISRAVIILMDNSLHEYYKSLPTTELHVKFKALTKLIFSDGTCSSKHIVHCVLPALPANNFALTFWNALAESLCESGYDQCLLVPLKILMWPLNKINKFTEVKVPAMTWYTTYISMYPRINKTDINKEIAEMIFSATNTTNSSVFFRLCVVIGLLKHKLAESNCFNCQNEINLLMDLTKSIDTYENFEQIFPMVVDNIVAIMTSVTSNVNEDIATLILVCTENVLNVLTQGCKELSDGTPQLLLIEHLLKPLEELFTVEAYIKLIPEMTDYLLRCSLLLVKLSTTQTRLLSIMKTILTKIKIFDVNYDKIKSLITDIEDGKFNNDATQQKSENNNFTTPQTNEIPKRLKKKEANIVSTVMENGEEYVVVKSHWKFNPRKLTENQKEKLQRKREDIPALYQDLSQSQDEFKLVSWKTDSQDTTSSSKSESKSNKPDKSETATEILKNLPSSNVVPKIIENFFSDKEKNESVSKETLSKEITGDLKVSTPSPKTTKTRRMALKDRVFRNVRNLIENSGLQKENQNLSDDPNKTIGSTKTPVHTKPNNTVNVVNSAPTLLSADRPSRVKRKPKKFEDLELLTSKRSRHSLHDMMPDKTQQDKDDLSINDKNLADSSQEACNEVINMDISLDSKNSECSNFNKDNEIKATNSENEKHITNSDIIMVEEEKVEEVNESNQQVTKCKKVIPIPSSSEQLTGFSNDNPAEHAESVDDVPTAKSPKEDAKSLSSEISKDITPSLTANSDKETTDLGKNMATTSIIKDVIPRSTNVDDDIVIPKSTKVVDEVVTTESSNLVHEVSTPRSSKTVNEVSTPRSSKLNKKLLTPSVSKVFKEITTPSRAKDDNISTPKSSKPVKEISTPNDAKEVSTPKTSKDVKSIVTAKPKKDLLESFPRVEVTEIVDHTDSENLADIPNAIKSDEKVTLKQSKDGKVLMTPKQSKTNKEVSKSKDGKGLMTPKQSKVVRAIMTPKQTKDDKEVITPMQSKEAMETVTPKQSNDKEITNPKQSPKCDEQKSTVKKKSRIEKELAIDTVEGHPYLKIQSAKRLTRKALESANTGRRKSLAEKLNKSKTEINNTYKSEKKMKGKNNESGKTLSTSVVVDESQERDSEQKEHSSFSEDLPYSDDVIESSQDSTITTISVKSTKKTPAKVPIVCIPKLVSPSNKAEDINTSQSILERVVVDVHRLPDVNNDSKDDSVLPLNKTVDEDPDDQTENMDTEPMDEPNISEDIILIKDDDPVIAINDTIIGPETQEIAEADTQPTDPKQFMDIDETLESIPSTSDIPAKQSENSVPDVCIVECVGPDIVKDQSTVPNLDVNNTANNTTVTLSYSTCADFEQSSGVSSPFKDEAQRQKDFLNNTIEISPIKTMSPERNKKSPSPETSSDYVVITLSSPVHSNGEPYGKSGSPEVFTEDKVSPDKRDQSPPRVEITVTNTSPSSSLSLKKNRPQVRSGGRAAQMLGLCVPNKVQAIVNPDSNESEEIKKGNSTNTPARRNLRILYNSVGDNTESSNSTSENDEGEHFLRFRRSLPSVDSSPSGPILKRKLAEITDDAMVSPASKRKRVSFHDPPVSTTISVQKYIEPGVVRSPQNSAQKRLERQMRQYTPVKSPKRLDNVFKLDTVLTKTVESFTENDIVPISDDTQQISLDETPMVEIVRVSELNDTDPICPELLDCQDSIDNIAAELSSSAMKSLLIKELEGKIKTIGDLARMTELEVNRLCIKAPKVKVARKVLAEYASKCSDKAENEMIVNMNEINEPMTKSDKNAIDVEVQTDTNVSVETEVQTVEVATRTITAQTDTLSSMHAGIQTDESGSKTTADIVKSCLIENADFVEQLSAQLEEISIEKLSEKLPLNTLINLLLRKVTPSDTKLVLTQVLESSSSNDRCKELSLLRDYLCDRFDSKDLVLLCSQILKVVHDKPV